MELKHYAFMIRKRLWLITAIVVISCSLAATYSYWYAKPQYEASAKLLVGQVKDGGGLMSSLDLNLINSNIQLIKTYKEIIKTPRIMGIVAEEYPQLNQTAGELASKVTVTSVNDTQVMSVTARDMSYENAARIVNAVSVVFSNEIPKLLQVDNVSILNQADPKAKAAPVAPNAKLNIAMAFVLSLLAGMGVAFLLEYLDDTIKTEEDVAEALGLPVLTVIPKFKESEAQPSGGSSRNMNQIPAPGRVGRKSNVSLDA
ncbi:Wzz/FepE/Etk N-terminal domain-containing protein [Paenibacillus pasadenensis]|uniref:YveK family protein n=1 Tax=Paenibacillus pasadenensis TaxID=217090 RepID=UPI00203E62B0|nr:Wzz/FepE/Etk N-terminal domain-containing protein [Paenibacillus pasadenensis]MCM3748275.1 Wzz/FepE/Etk N-terminal domain-containing protein [Paenibacillus pasadenensis]